jgi:hypothetical protein
MVSVIRASRQDTWRNPADVALMQLIDRRTEDGSRHFANLPEACTWQALCEHILLLSGTQIANFVAAGLSEAWIDFTYQGHRFSVRHEGGRFCFFVRDPQCPDLSLYRVASHCEDLLGST